MNKRILQFVLKNELISKGDKVLAALSGGSDSVFMTLQLAELSKKIGFELAAVHINHNMRKTSSKDEMFADRLCKKLGIEIYIIRAESGTLKSELDAREFRYAAFDRICENHGFNRIATAHNLDDNCETVVLNFIRGAAAGGMSGIPVKRGRIIRPVLDISKSEILEFLNKIGQDFVTDETNLTDAYTRNRVRHNLIPQILEYNPNFARTVTQNSGFFAKDEEYFEAVTSEYMSKYFENNSLPTEVLKSLPYSISSRMIISAFKTIANESQAPSGELVLAALELCKGSKSGKTAELGSSVSMRIEYDRAVFLKNEIYSFSYNIRLGESVYIPETGKRITLETNTNGRLAVSSDSALILRSRKNGDFIYPVGMTGKKLVSDIFSDKKMPIIERNRTPLLVSGEDIVSVVGVRDDRRFTTDGVRFNIIIDEVK